MSVFDRVGWVLVAAGMSMPQAWAEGSKPYANNGVVEFVGCELSLTAQQNVEAFTGGGFAPGAETNYIFMRVAALIESFRLVQRNPGNLTPLAARLRRIGEGAELPTHYFEADANWPEILERAEIATDRLFMNQVRSSVDNVTDGITERSPGILKKIYKWLAEQFGNVDYIYPHEAVITFERAKLRTSPNTFRASIKNLAKKILPGSWSVYTPRRVSWMLKHLSNQEILGLMNGATLGFKEIDIFDDPTLTGDEQSAVLVLHRMAEFGHKFEAVLARGAQIGDAVSKNIYLLDFAEANMTFFSPSQLLKLTSRMAGRYEADHLIQKYFLEPSQLDQMAAAEVIEISATVLDNRIADELIFIFATSQVARLSVWELHWLADASRRRVVRHVVLALIK